MNPRQSAFQKGHSHETCSVRGPLCHPLFPKRHRGVACCLCLLPLRISARAVRLAKTTFASLPPPHIAPVVLDARLSPDWFRVPRLASSDECGTVAGSSSEAGVSPDRIPLWNGRASSGSGALKLVLRQEVNFGWLVLASPSSAFPSRCKCSSALRSLKPPDCFEGRLSSTAVCIPTLWSRFAYSTAQTCVFIYIETAPQGPEFILRLKQTISFLNGAQRKSPLYPNWTNFQRPGKGHHPVLFEHVVASLRALNLIR